MNRFLFLSLIIAIVTAVFFKLQSDNRLLRATNAENRASALETAVNERDKMIEINSQANEQNEQFKGKMNEDTTDNLDVVPADYILKQLRAD
jgi:predicted Holliday junction resolvase-like endonuclease